MADAEAKGLEAEPIEDAPSPESRPVLQAVPIEAPPLSAEAVAADVSFDNAPEPEEQPLAPAEEATSAAEAGSWQPIGVVQADGQTFLGIDFGAAFSKVALKTDISSPATPVPLSLMAYEILQKADLVHRFENRNEYAEESLVYCDHNEFVFCGMLAKKLSLEAAETGQNRPAIQNLKTFLVRGGANLQIHSDFFPGSESLDSQSVLAIYLAYLLRLTRHYLNYQTGSATVDLDRTIRNFSIPTWIEERYREDVKGLFRGAAAYAFCLERWLKDDLIKGARLPEVRKALQEAREHTSKIEETLVGSIVTESAAAGQARLLNLNNDKTRPLTVFVVNVGAGFTDFALFTLGHTDGHDGNTTTRLAHRGGVGTGLGVWDNALKTLLFNRVREAPAARRKTDEFRRFKARLELQVRDIKENLLASDDALPIDISPVFQEPLVIDKLELENSLPVKAALFGIRDGLRVFIKEAIKALGMHRFDPAFTEIIVTGGGAFLPSVVDCIREGVATLGPGYPSRVRSDYVSPLYTTITDIGRLYPLLAVSLGVTEKEYTAEDATPARTTGASAPNQEIMPAVSFATAQNGQNGRPRSTHEVKIPTKRTGRFRLS